MMTAPAADRGDAPTDDPPTPPTWESGGTWGAWESGQMPSAVARGLERALDRFHAGDQPSGDQPLSDQSPGDQAAPGEAAATADSEHDRDDKGDASAREVGPR